MVGTVYFLGAGFSGPAGGPLSGDFLNSDWVKKCKVARAMWDEPEFEIIWRVLHDLPDDEQNIEAVLSTLSSAGLFSAKFGRYSPRRVMRFVIEYVAICVSESLANPKKDLLYERFFHDVMPAEAAIITTNYDLIADFKMMAEFGSFDYGLPATKAYRYLGLRWARSGPFLLKLHGSLSWLRCRSCGSIWLAPENVFHRTGSKCVRPTCQGTYEVVIVPPTWNKEAAARFLRIVWEEAYRQLRSASRIVVVGYSFPRLDRAALDLFRTALSRNAKASLDVHCGSGLDYSELSATIGHKIQSRGLRLEELVEQSQG